MQGWELSTVVTDAVVLKHQRVVSLMQVLQNNLMKIYNATNYNYGENFKLKLCICVQSMALGTCTKLWLEILIRSMISDIHKFPENILESSLNIIETAPRPSVSTVLTKYALHMTSFMENCYIYSKQH